MPEMTMKKAMFQEKAQVVSNTAVAQNYYRMSLLSPMVAAEARPGQFIEVQVSQSGEPLLRRPFGVHAVNQRKQTVDILYEVRGKGTQALSEKKPGDFCDILGPLGNGFSIQNARCSILVAGGMGVAPLAYLAEKLARDKFSEQKAKNLVLIGCKTKRHIMCKKELEKFGYAVKISTDDGSLGFKGYVTDLLEKVLRVTRYKLPVTIYACGPKPMLKEVSRIAREKNISAQLSLEEHMACGIGACLGCVVKTTNGYKRVCKDGPVFEAGSLVW
jgi:dihydroorotate dehydrogenase electron transfer subunit